MRFLTSPEVDQFRSDFRQKEQEIQKNIAVYLSALVVAVGWIVGPQARPLEELVLGNHALNACGILMIGIVNAIFATFLAYKGLVIHEYMQFVTFLTKADSAIQYWEAWRRSELSITKRWSARYLHNGAISAVPWLGAILLLWITWAYLHLPDQSIQAYVHAKNSPSCVMHPAGSELAARAVIDDQAELGEVYAGIRRARVLWWGVLAVHVVPLIVFLVSFKPADKLWARIRATKVGIPSFDSLNDRPTDSTSPSPISGSVDTPKRSEEDDEE